MLRRELYAGRIIWNRSKFVKQPGTNKRLRRERPSQEWLVTEKPELRIIDAALWDAVQARLSRMAEKYAKPGLMHRAATSPYLMTGFLKCGSCGANLVIVTGRTKGAHPKYGCPQNFYRGACTNGLKERADWLEDRLLSELQSAVMRPEVVDYALGEFERQLNKRIPGGRLEPNRSPPPAFRTASSRASEPRGDDRHMRAIPHPYGRHQ
jgi:hypothetical protein